MTGHVPDPSPGEALAQAVQGVLRWGSRDDVQQALAADAGGDLSPTDGWLLDRIVAFGPARMSELASWKSVDRSTMTTEVTRLERRGLVSRTADPHDRRAVLVQATEAGQELCRDLVRSAGSVLDRALAGWSPEDRQGLITSLTRFLHQVQQPAPAPAKGPVPAGRGPRIIHTAQALVDEVVEIPALPERGGNVMATGHGRYAASAVNVLLAAARSAATCVLAGSVGVGPDGDLIRRRLHAERVQISSPPVADLDSGTCFVMLEPDGQRTFVTTLGAERRITPDTLQSSAPGPGDLVCVSGYTLLGATREPLLTWLEGLPDGVAVILDPGAAFAQLPAEVAERMRRLVTVWSGNAEEAWAECGQRDPQRAAAAIAERLGGAVTLVRDGAAGCAVAVDQTVTMVPGFPQRPVDTNGAGDAHTGIVLAARAAGQDWLTAVRRANAGAAIKVTRRGPATAPTAAEIDRFLAGPDAGTAAQTTAVMPPST